MTNEGTVQMIVIGADTHKRTHALAAVDAGTGRSCGARQIEAEQDGHLAALRRARELDEQRVWALEDVRGVLRRLEQALIAAGERVIRVAPHRMGASRRGERQALPAGARVRVARDQIAQLRVLGRQIDALHSELRELVTAHRPQLLEETGCGALTAAILIGRTAGAERFPTDASFARQTGTAPIPASSGLHDRHRLDRGGDRQLSHALHIIAITRSRYDPKTKTRGALTTVSYVVLGLVWRQCI